VQPIAQESGQAMMQFPAATCSGVRAVRRWCCQTSQRRRPSNTGQERSSVYGCNGSARRTTQTTAGRETLAGRRATSGHRGGQYKLPDRRHSAARPSCELGRQPEGPRIPPGAQPRSPWPTAPGTAGRVAARAVRAADRVGRRPCRRATAKNPARPEACTTRRRLAVETAARRAYPRQKRPVPGRRSRRRLVHSKGLNGTNTRRRDACPSNRHPTGVLGAVANTRPPCASTRRARSATARGPCRLHGRRRVFPCATFSRRGKRDVEDAGEVVFGDAPHESTRRPGLAVFLPRVERARCRPAACVAHRFTSRLPN
jgi:hypothetical protein